MERLFLYLNRKMPVSVDYEDLANLCFSLYCTLDILPKNLQSLGITKDVLAMTFTSIARERNISVYSSDDFYKKNLFYDCTNNQHWIDLIDNCVKLDRSPDLTGAKALLRSTI